MSDQHGPPMACAVCGQVIDEVKFDDNTVGWQHTAASVDDHVVVPVRTEEVRTNFRCDFCTVDGARWVLPVEDYKMGLPPEWSGPSYGNAADWAACDDCALALRSNDWNKIIYRADRAFRKRNPELPRMPRDSYVQMYRELRAHITGPVRLRT